MAQAGNDYAGRLQDLVFCVLRKRNFQALTFQEFRNQYKTSYHTDHPPERAKLMKLAMVKVTYSAKRGKQTMKLLLERDYICAAGNDCDDSNCPRIHCLLRSDRCPLFDRDERCSNAQCSKVHIPAQSLHSRITQLFRKAHRSSMPFSKFIVRINKEIDDWGTERGASTKESTFTALTYTWSARL